MPEPSPLPRRSSGPVSNFTNEELAHEIVDAFEILADLAPELAYATYAKFAPIVRGAEYERIEIIRVPYDDSPEDFETKIRFRGEEHDEQDGGLKLAVVAERGLDSLLNPDEQTVTFSHYDYDHAPRWEHVVCLFGDVPVRLPEGWKEGS